MLGLGCLKLDEKGKIFMVSDVRKMHLTSDTSVFLKKNVHATKNLKIFRYQSL